MSWQRISGHDALIEGFRRVVSRGRLAHAYLFIGPAGVGKRLFATELARALLCEKPRACSARPGDVPLDACDACPACIQIDAGTHPDYHFAAKPPEVLEFPIDLMREVCASFALKSARGRGKVVVIDGADDFNDESANCFLKTLEEPPPRSLLILIGSNPERQMATIVSRCQTVRFAPLADGLVRGLLEKSGVEVGMIDRLVRLGAGSPGAALALANPALWEFRKKFLAGLASWPIDSVELAKAWGEFVEEAGKESAPRRGRAQLVIRLLIDFLDDVLQVALGGEQRRTGAEDAKLVRSLAQRLQPEQVLGLLERCLEADEQVDRRVVLDLVLEALMDALAQKVPR
jgi:DNA polymerase-3 subunit delta'